VNSKVDSSMPEEATDRARQGIESQYLTTREVAARLRWSVRTIRAKVRAGLLRRGVHYFQPAGSQYRWKWSAVVAWMENDGTSVETR
jgi:excisionase family DNA binding protein